MSGLHVQVCNLCHLQYKIQDIHADFSLVSFFDLEDGGNMSSKCQLTFYKLHDIISQKTELFITIDARTSDPI
jgi:hypothetical protein